jgi:predicted O-methyltransferase YrrM
MGGRNLLSAKGFDTQAKERGWPMLRDLLDLKYVYLAYFSQPAEDRILYRAIRRNKVRRILEVGVGNGARAGRMIALALRNKPAEPVEYTGIDLFEARKDQDGVGVSLKLAHRMLSQTAARIRLVPGDAFSALSRTANTLASTTDLIVVSADQDAESVSKAWFYVPRMLHAKSLVYREEAIQTPTVDVVAKAPLKTLRLIPRAEIDKLARSQSRRRAA